LCACRNVAVTDQLALVNVTLLIPPQEAEQMAAAARAAIDAASGTTADAVLSIVYPTAAGPLPVVYRSLSVTRGTAAGQKALAAAAAAEVAQADLSQAGRRRLLAGVAAGPPAGNSSAYLAGNATAELASQLTVCAGSLQGLGLIGSNVCMVASTQLPLPPDYIWYEPFNTGSSNAGGWPSWQSAVVALAVALPVLAAVTFVLVTAKRRRQRKYMQHQLPAKEEATTDSMSEGGAGAANSNGSSGAAAMPSKEQLLSFAAASANGSNAKQQQQQWQQWSNPAFSKLSAGAVSRNSVLMGMGHCKLARLHQRAHPCCLRSSSQGQSVALISSSG
jgi:hypothetical protein